MRIYWLKLIMAEKTMITDDVSLVHHSHKKMSQPESILSLDEVKNQLDTATNIMIKLRSDIDQRMNEIKQMEASWNDKLELMGKEARKAKNMIKLNVGGMIFKASKEVLMSHKDTYFYAMLSSRRFLPDEDGAYCIDRDPQLFPYILDYLRNGTVDMTDLTETQQEQLSIEADFYMIDMSSYYLDRFDYDLKGPQTIISNDRKTASHEKDQNGHTAALSMKGISTGKHIWRVQINKIATHWISVGVIEKPVNDLSCSYKQSYGISSANQKYNAKSVTNSLVGNWANGDVLSVDLDCDAHILKITNETNGKMEQWTLPSSNVTYYLHVNIYNMFGSVTIL